MDIKRLESSIDEVKTIHHTADWHIRNLKRHDEYLEVFAKFIKELEKDKEDAICVIVGDIAHAKTEMSPELIEMISLFLKKCIKLMPTFIIPGNHDANLNNKQRQDALTPIIRNIEHPNLFYFKKSGVYQYANINFVHWSQFDDKEAYIKADELPNDGRYSIALFHAPVDKSVTDYGYVMKSDKINADDFKGFDLALLGDIHKHQFLDEEETICYPGSLIMQNHGEYLSNHGYVKWKLPSKEHEFINIQNDYEFFTIDVEKGKIPDVSDIPAKPRLRVRFKDTPSAQINDLIYEIRKKYTPTELRQNRVYKKERDFEQERENTRLDIGNVKDIAYQNELISDYLKNNTDVTDEILKEILEINEQLNNEIELEELTSNVKWNPIKFEFENMFSYGKGNVVHFDNKKGAVGIFAPNGTGKSSILSALTFCLFDKCMRANKSGDVMNNQSDTFKCKLKFEIDGTIFFIERIGSRRTYSDSIKVDVNFWKLDEDGNKIDMNGEQRYDTNANIRNYVGEYDDFVLTTLSLQNHNTMFIQMSQAERKDLLEQFMGLNIFSKLEEIGTDNIKEVQSILKDLRKKDFAKQLADVENKIEQHKSEFEDLKIEKEEKTTALNKLRVEIVSKTKELKDIGNIDTNIEKLKSNKKSTINQIDEFETIISESKESLGFVQDNIISIKEHLSDFDIEFLEDQQEKINKKKETRNELKREISSLRTNITNKQELVDHLKDHEYDPECKYCVQNKFVQKATKAKNELPNLKSQLEDLESQRDELTKEIDEFTSIETQIESYYDLKSELTQAKSDKQSLTLKIENNEVKKESAENNLKSIESKIKDYYDHLDDIEHNENVQTEIDELEQEYEEAEESLNEVSDRVQDVHSDIKVEERERKRIKRDIKREKELDEKYTAYGYYLEAVKRDGVPYLLISKAIPTIEEEVNNILAQIVDFGVILDVDGKNINTKIVFDENRIWPLEMASGMEKFVSALALRTALINVSSLPRPNFIAIDEGFGNLDSDNLNSMFLLFDYLKTQFEFIMIISHLESMRDVVDTIVEVQKKGNRSFVNT